MTEMKSRLDETGCPAKCDFVGRLVFLWMIVDMDNINFFLTLTLRQVICSICTKGGEKNGL